MADDQEVIAVLKEANEAGGGVFGAIGIPISVFLAKPPAGSVLVAVEVPPFGGDTLWANQELALAMLPAELRRQITGRDGIHSGKPYGVAHTPPPETQSGRSIKMTRGDPAADREQAHPLIRRHPESGVDALFVNPIYTTRLADRDEAASADLLARLYHHATQPGFAVAGAGGRATSRFGTTARPCITRSTITMAIAACSIERLSGTRRTPDNQLLAGSSPRAIVKRATVKPKAFTKPGSRVMPIFSMTRMEARFSGSAMPKRWSRRRWSKA